MKFQNILIFSALVFPVAAYAGNSLEQTCDMKGNGYEYISGQNITAINYVSNWIDGGPGINVHVGNGWYGQFLPSRSDGFNNNYLNFGGASLGTASLINMAYVDHLSVNLCVYGGYFIGIELDSH